MQKTHCKEQNLFILIEQLQSCSALSVCVCVCVCVCEHALTNVVSQLAILPIVF